MHLFGCLHRCCNDGRSYNCYVELRRTFQNVSHVVVVVVAAVVVVVVCFVRVVVVLSMSVY